MAIASPCFTIDIPKVHLGRGSSAKVYLGTAEEPKGTSKVAIARIPIALFRKPAFDLLSALPYCKELLARPLYSYEVAKHSKRKIYLVEPLLPGPNLREHLNPLPFEKKIEVFIHGMRSMAQGLAFLHAHGIVHRDPTLENGSYYGIFDYGSLVKIGEVKCHYGAGSPHLPPEVVVQTVAVLEKAEPSDDLVKRLERYRKRQQELNLPDAYISYWKERAKDLPPSCQPYFPPCDAYILGTQWLRVYPKWREATDPRSELTPLLESMLDIDPEKRPPMTKVAELLDKFYMKYFSICK